MKTLLPHPCLVVLFCAFAFPSVAQDTLFYDFEDGQMPTSFILLNEDGLEPELEGDSIYRDSAWVTFFSNILNSYAARSISYYTNDEGPADDWMILPKTMMGTGGKLSWTALSTTSGTFPDSYQVLINSGNPTKADFLANGDTLATIDPEDFGTPKMRMADLSSYAGQEVHIAFRNITDSGDALLIDDIMVTSTPTSISVLAPSDFKMVIQPNPCASNGQLRFELRSGGNVSYFLSDALGRRLQQTRIGQLSAGSYSYELPLSHLPAGRYQLSLLSDAHMATQSILLIR